MHMQRKPNLCEPEQTGGGGGRLYGKMLESGQGSAGLKGITPPLPQIWSQSEALTCLGDDSLGSEKQWAEKERIRKNGRSLQRGGKSLCSRWMFPVGMNPSWPVFPGCSAGVCLHGKAALEPALNTLGLRSVSNWPGLFWGAMVAVSGHTLAEVLFRWCPVCVSHTPCPVLSGGRMH